MQESSKQPKKPQKVINSLKGNIQQFNRPPPKRFYRQHIRSKFSKEEAFEWLLLLLLRELLEITNCSFVVSLLFSVQLPELSEIVIAEEEEVAKEVKEIPPSQATSSTICWRLKEERKYVGHLEITSIIT